MTVSVDSPPIIPGTAPRPRVAVWARLVVVAVILAVSGGIRAWQEHRVEQSLKLGRGLHFALADIPMNLGSWRGSPTSLDPRIVRISGSSDVMVRRYVDGLTGTTVVVLVNYGNPSDMLGHVPEVCYPAAGYEPVGIASERPIVPVGGAASVPFRSLLYSKGEGGTSETQEVYYSLCYDGRWTTTSKSPKASRRVAGMYKVQVCRMVGSKERHDIENPCEPFAALLLAEIEARIAGDG